MESNINSILVIIPTYNEARNITFLIEKILSLNSNFSVLVVDDNSPDGTTQEVEKLQEKHSNLHLITRSQKLGLGSAYKEGFRYALRYSYDIITQMDADLSHQPFYIPYMMNLLERYDLVIGSRYVKGGGISNWPKRRILLSKAANYFCKRLLGIPLNDLTSGFKCSKKRVLEGVDFTSISSTGYSFQIEMVYRAFLKGFKIAEYPIIFRERRNEKSKMTLKIVLEAFSKVIFLWFRKSLNLLILCGLTAG